MREERWLLWVARHTGSWSCPSPVVADGVVHVAGGYLYGVDAETGEVRWTFEEGQGFPACPTVADGVVYVWNADGFFYAVDARTGEQLWRSEIGWTSSAPAVADGVVAVGALDEFSPGAIYALDAESGKVIWQYDLRWASPTVADGVVYVTSGGSLYAFRAGDPTE